jgi:hypothetical protein
VVNIEGMHDVAVLVDPVDDAIGAAQRAVTAGEWPVQRLADPMRIDRKRGIAEFQMIACGPSGTTARRA